jgi:TldD protein
MSTTSDLAFRVGDQLRAVPAPWDVFAERSQRFEVHLNGPRVELSRGPIVLEGYGVRVLRAHDGVTGVGYQASTDYSPEGVRAAVEDAETVARFGQFPAKHPELPGKQPNGTRVGTIVDPVLWADPRAALDGHVAALIAAFEGRSGVVPSFGSVKATLTEVSLANSSGFAGSYAHTVVETEVAVKAYGGPEGRPPGEYWVTELGRRLATETLPASAAEWSRYAEDARHAKSPPNGELPVILPPEVLEGILPRVLGFQFSGGAKLRGLSVAAGSQVGIATLHVADDGTAEWGIGTSPFDDEGTGQRKRSLITEGKANELLYDVLHADALGSASTGNGVRAGGFDPTQWARWKKFTRRPGPESSTIVVSPGDGGKDAELVEGVADGIWVQQIGWANPDPLSGAFGGEIRIGYRIRGGKLAEPVRGGTVGGIVLARGDGPSLFRNISAIGSTVKLSGVLSSPTVVVRSLAISGEEKTEATASP